MNVYTKVLLYMQRMKREKPMKRLNKEVVFSIVWTILWFLHPLLLVQGLAAEPERITVVNLKRLLDAGDDVVLVDVRSQRQYNAGHLPGAISMPFPGQIQARHQELPPEGLIILY